MPTFDDVVASWDTADPDAIHPLRKVSKDDYWASGVAQAEEAAQWIPEGGLVVDFGCGDGRLTIPLALFGYKVIAVDSSTEMLRRLRANMKERGGFDQMEAILNSNGLSLPKVLGLAGLVDGVDAVIARAVLIHHDHKSVTQLVYSLGQVIKPGGHFIADWPVGEHHERRDWLDVTIWTENHRLLVGAAAGLQLVDGGTPSVWVKV